MKLNMEEKNIQIDNRILDKKKEINNIDNQTDEMKKKISFLEEVITNSKLACKAAQEDSATLNAGHLADDIMILTNRFVSSLDESIIQEKKDRNNLYSKKDLLEKELRNYYIEKDEFDNEKEASLLNNDIIQNNDNKFY